MRWRQGKGGCALWVASGLSGGQVAGPMARFDMLVVQLGTCSQMATWRIRVVMALQQVRALYHSWSWQVLRMLPEARDKVHGLPTEADCGEPFCNSIPRYVFSSFGEDAVHA